MEEAPTDSSRAKEIDSGVAPLHMENVILNLPFKDGLQFDNRESVNAIKWAFEQLVSQKQYLTTVTIPMQGNAKQPYFIMPNSWDVILDLHFRKFRNLFFMTSWKWNLTFEIRSNFQQVGMLSIVFVNCPVSALPYLTGSPLIHVENKLTDINEAGKKGVPSEGVNGEHSVFELASIVQLPHKHIMLGENQNVSVVMNWLSPYKSSFRNVSPVPQYSIHGDQLIEANNPIYDMGFIYLNNPIPLNCASGADSNCTVRVWSHLTDVEYAGYCPTDTII